MMEHRTISRSQALLIWAVLASVGVAVYLPTFRVQFHLDDLDFFSGLCLSMKQGNLLQWIFRFTNGHLAVIPTLAYYIDYRYFERSVWLWHAAEMVLRAIGVGSVLYILLHYIRRWEIAVFFGLIYATSTLYSWIFVHTTSFNHLCATTFTLGSMALFAAYLRHGGRWLYAASVALGISGIISSAMGLVVFPAQIMMLWASEPEQRRRLSAYLIPSAGTILSFGLFWLMGRTGQTEGHLNIIFGLKQTVEGILHRTVPDFSSVRAVSLALAVWAAINLIMLLKLRAVRWRFMIMSASLIVVPLMLNTSFREEFGHPGRVGKYHGISILGMLLILAEAMCAPHMDKVISFFRTRAVGWVALTALAVALSVSAYKDNSDIETYREVRLFEDLMAEASIEFAEKYQTKNIPIAEREIKPPLFPFTRNWASIACYCPPYDKGLSFFSPAPDDNRFVELLESDAKYLPVLKTVTAAR